MVLPLWNGAAKSIRPIKKMFFRNRYFLLLIIIILLVSQAGLLYFSFSKNTQLDFLPLNLIKPQPQSPVHLSYFSQAGFFDEAYQQAQNQVKMPVAKVYGGIVPHHLLVKDKIAAYFKGLENDDYQTVILISPNHFNYGRANVISSQADWQTPYPRYLQQKSDYPVGG